MSFRMSDLVLKVSTINAPKKVAEDACTDWTTDDTDGKPADPQEDSQIFLLREQLQQALLR